MIAVEYKARFHMLARHAISILTTMFERVHFFVRGLRLPLCLFTQNLVLTARSFVEVSDHAQLMKEMHHEA